MWVSIKPADTATRPDGVPVLVGAARGNFGIKRRYHLEPVTNAYNEATHKESMSPAPRCTMSGADAQVCPRHDLGCRALVARGQLDAHISTCPFVLMQSFIAETRARMEALERDNRALRCELRVLTAAAKVQDALWHEAQCCERCGSVFFDARQELSPAAAPKEVPVASAVLRPPPSACTARAPFPMRGSVRSPYRYGRTEDTVDMLAAEDPHGEDGVLVGILGSASSDSRATSSSKHAASCRSCQCVPMRLWKSKRAREVETAAAERYTTSAGAKG